jgi:ribosomal protein L37E
MIVPFSVKDLLDYLIQLLGSDRQDQLRDFVDDVGRVQRGEMLAVAKATTTAVVEQEKIAPKSDVNFKKKISPKVAAVVDKKPIKKATPKIETRNEKASSKTSTPKLETAMVKPQPLPISSVPTPPRRGKASVVCGCFGTTHLALSNCLRCGRISCEREGYDYCAFCGYLVEEKSIHLRNDRIDAASWELQQRLLRYDRQFAQRTVVVDDQADYYSSQATSTWLNESEQQEAAQREVQRHNEMHHRQKMTLDLDL